MELTNLQKSIVDQLVALYNPTQKTKVDFKAPTGSGKTLMASAFISEIMAQNSEDKFVFVIATPSSSELPFSFEQKILQYKQDMVFADFSVEYIKSPSETNKNDAKTDGTIRIIPEKNKVYIFGKSSFGKDRILTTRHIINDFVDMIKNNGYRLIYIRDEAHIGGNIVNDENFESLMQSNADMVVKMTATPDYRDTTINKVVLTEEDLNNPTKNDGKYLLKTQAITLLKDSMTDDDMLNDAIENFKAIKEEYKQLEQNGIYIRPAMLIQVKNDSKTNTEESIAFNESLQKIKKELTQNGLSWVQYFGSNDKDSDRVYKDKFTLNDITDNLSDIDAIIFKVGPATGWDIPRACMLLQLRKVCSEGLNVQTIGRIKRNCYPRLEKNDITDKYYIYSNAPQDRNLSVFNAKVKEKFANEEFMAIEITNVKECSKKVSEQGLRTDLLKYLADNKNKIIQTIKNYFIKDSNGLFYKDVHSTAVGGEYITKITNVFQFIKKYQKSRLNNEDFFEKCEKILYGFWKDNLANVDMYGYKCLKEIFYLIIVERFKNDIVNLINKNKQYKTKYKVVSGAYTPQAYTEIYTNALHEERTRISSYLFDTKFNGRENYQPIGENKYSPEVYVFNKISDIDYDKECIKVWGKNFTTSNVNSAYIDKYNNLKHSYFDFIVKFNNNALLYIEVKGEKDINPEKTEMLKGAYKEYFDKQHATMFDKPVVISIFKVNTANGNITHDSFYDENIIKEDLTNLTVEELFETISKIKTLSL